MLIINNDNNNIENNTILKKIEKIYLIKFILLFFKKFIEIQYIF